MRRHASSLVPHTRLVDATRPAALAEVARTEAALLRFLERPSVTALPEDEQACIADAVASVRVLLSRCADSIMTASTMGAVDDQLQQVHAVRPQNHGAQVVLLQDLGALIGMTSAHARILHDLSAIVAAQHEAGQDARREQEDLASARLAIAESTLALASARERVLALSAVSSPWMMDRAGADVDRVRRLLEHAAERLMLVELSFQPVAVA